jgi:hypothetical protein
VHAVAGTDTPSDLTHDTDRVLTVAPHAGWEAPYSPVDQSAVHPDVSYVVRVRLGRTPAHMVSDTAAPCSSRHLTGLVEVAVPQVDDGAPNSPAVQSYGWLGERPSVHVE